MKNRYSNLIKELKRAKKTARFSVVRDGERVMITTDVFAVRIEESEYNDYIKPAFPDIDIEKGCYLMKDKENGRSFSAKSDFEYAYREKDRGEYATLSPLCINSAVDGDTIIRVLTTDKHVAMINQNFLNMIDKATGEIIYFGKQAPILFTDIFMDVLICPIWRGIHKKEDFNEWLTNNVLRIA